MIFPLLLRCIAIGFSISTPLGPIDLLCINNTLTGGIRVGLATALGAATADLLYVILIALSMHTITTFLLAYQTILTVVGGLFLCYLGITTILAQPTVHAARISKNSLLQTYLTTLFLKLVNPVTILDFMALFTSLRIDVTGYSQSLEFIIGTSLGCTLWWLLLCSTINIFHTKISTHLLQWINYLAGIAILSLGIWSLAKPVL